MPLATSIRNARLPSPAQAVADDEPIVHVVGRLQDPARRFEDRVQVAQPRVRFARVVDERVAELLLRRALDLGVADDDAGFAERARRAARPAERPERAQARRRRVQERLPGRGVAARQQPDHLPARVQIPDRAAAAADLGASALRRVAVPEEDGGAVRAVGVAADGAVGRNRAGVALRAEAVELAQVLHPAQVGVTDRVHVAVGRRLAARRRRRRR